MKIKLRVVLPLLLIFMGVNTLADPLVLSDAEIQKLQHYFPTQEDNTHLIWSGNPITISLPVNQEKRIIFPGKILPDLKNALTTDQLRILNDNQSVYLTALKSFPTTRMYVTLQDSGEVLLVDLSTSDNASNATTYIDTQSNTHKKASSAAVTAEPMADDFLSEAASNPSTSDSDDYVTLIRFAWQQLYAPQRLLTNPLAISRAPMHTLPMLSTLIYGDKVYAHPESSWIYDDTYVTAIELRNKYSHFATINVSRNVCGNWQAASLYPRNTLKPAGDKEGDSTVLFLVSKVPFGEAMAVCNGRA